MNLKYTLLAIAIISFLKLSAQQNLVPNGNFEEYTTCPSITSQTANCTGWYPYSGATPDFFNSCAPTIVSVPTNFAGFQQAASGNGYVGGFVQINNGNPPNFYNEYIARTLPALSIGTTYEVSMSVSASSVFLAKTNGLGVYFFKNAPATIVSTGPLSVQPQVSYNGFGYITDTQNWVRLIDTFTADSAYDHLVIGGFNIAGNFMLPSAGTGYYYYDSVVVRVLANVRIQYNDSLLCAGDTIDVPYSITGVYNSGNAFNVQLSNATGNFSSPIIIGTGVGSSGTVRCVIPGNSIAGTGYRMRIVTSSPTGISDSTRLIKIGTLNKPISGSNSPVCTGTVLNLNATVTTVSPDLKWSWAGPSAFASNMNNSAILNVSLLQTGNYVVTANLYGCNAKDTVAVVVNPSPVKPIINSNAPLCEGTTLSLSAIAGSGLDYEWAGPGNFSSAIINPIISNATISTSGNYILTVKNSFNCIAKDTENIQVYVVPSVTASGNTPLCTGESLNLSASSIPAGASYSWVGPGGYTATIQNPVRSSVSTGMNGNYIVSAMLNGCTGRDTVAVQIFSTPPAPTINSNSPVCFGNIITLTSGSTPGATYSWTGPNGFSSAHQNPSKSYAVAADGGVYSVYATLDGCVSFASTTTVTVKPMPFVAVYPVPGDTICQGTAVTFIAVPANAGTTPSYKWTRNSSTSILSTASTFTTTSINNNDVVRCMLTDNQCPFAITDTSNEIKMTVLPWLTPSVSIVSNPTTPLSPYQLINFTATPVNGGTSPKYQWYRNNTELIGALSNVWSTQQLDNNDKISVVLTSSYRCPQPAKDTSNVIQVTVLTGIGDVENSGNLKLYPNPNEGMFIISAVGIRSKEVQLEVVSVTGQLLLRKRVVVYNSQMTEHVNLNDAANGMYILNVHGNGELCSLQFSVKR